MLTSLQQTLTQPRPPSRIYYFLCCIISGLLYSPLSITHLSHFILTSLRSHLSPFILISLHYSPLSITHLSHFMLTSLRYSPLSFYTYLSLLHLPLHFSCLSLFLISCLHEENSFFSPEPRIIGRANAY